MFVYLPDFRVEVSAREHIRKKEELSYIISYPYMLSNTIDN